MHKKIGEFNKLENIIFANDIRMKEFAESISEFKLPRWEQIPSLGLYMDQVVTVIEKVLTPVLGFNGEAFITSSMINNYVKLGMVRKPDKKKYSREHIACVLIITILKQSLAISDIRLGMDAVLKRINSENAYNSFCDYVEYAIKTVATSVISSDTSAEIDFKFVIGDAMITMAACSFATKIFTGKMVSMIREDENHEENN